MFGLDRRRLTRARPTSAGIDLPHVSARVTFLAASVVLLAFGILSNTALSSSIVESLGQQVSWLAVVSMAACSFAAGMCLSRARWSRPSRLLGAAIAFSTVAMLTTLASYERPEEPWLAASWLLWPALPIAIALWARAAFAVTGSLRRARTGVPSFWVGVTTFSRSLSRRRVRVLSVRVPHSELVGIWLPCAAFALTSLIPGFMFDRQEHDPTNSWSGWTFEPRWPYVLFCAWALVVLAVAALAVEGSWQSRRQGGFAGVIVRARSARIATKLAIVVVGALFVGAWTNSWPEPVLVIPVSVLLLFYSLGSVDADSYRDAAHAYSSIRRRWLWAVGWIATSVIFAAGYGRGPFMSGVYAAMIALLYCLLPAGLRAAEGIRQEVAEGLRRPKRLTAAAAEELAGFLAGRELTDSGVPSEALVTTQESLESLADDEVQLLIGGLPNYAGTKQTRERDPRNYVRLRRFIGDFPALDASGDFDARLYRFVELFHETGTTDPVVSAPLAHQRPRDAHNPSNLWIVDAYCRQRITTAENADEEREETSVRLRYSVWLRRSPNGPSDGKPVYYWIGGTEPSREIAHMTLEDARAALKTIVGRDVYGASKKKRQRALADARKRVKARWLERLRELEDMADRQRPHPTVN